MSEDKDFHYYDLDKNVWHAIWKFRETWNVHVNKAVQNSNSHGTHRDCDCQ